MNIKYAQLDTDGKVIGVSYLAGIVEDDNLIQIEDDFSPWGMKYNKKKNEWVKAPQKKTEAVSEEKTIQEELSEVKEMLNKLIKG